ncbi:predicted xylanase/chitin deacetylase [Chthonomonas calidirosea]|uniref:polysaccharide deacetylase family protein n=1 Tax=Chthonomonas calidirosea TaxID=454171 RepID=UPI0006DD4609|nr:polysaccharide deacetylase family protein [Chthonomonas calidirosea]CEK15261.1 predicted xylanase/chitin deacetylase [Chthonomonas calidirosea]
MFQYTRYLKHSFRRLLAPLALAGLSLFGGCNRFTASFTRPIKLAALPTANATPVPTKLTQAELERIRPNEVGFIPILEYHNIHPGRYMTCRSAALFREDIERLYRLGYRPISLKEYLEDRIALPPGKKPVIFTFDDALLTQFRYLPDGRIDPNCAVGILMHFHTLHPDWALKGVFFVVPTNAFGNRHQFQKKLLTLQKLGFEIANHTYDHKYFNHLSDDGIEREIALGKAMIDKLDPKAETSFFAIPGGCTPRSRHWWIMCRGRWHNLAYANQAILLAAGGPAPAPCARQFNPYRIPRIVAYNGPDGLWAWIDWLQKHPQKVYISDGDPNTITIPAALSDLVNKKRLALEGLTLQTYDIPILPSSRHFAVRQPHRASHLLAKLHHRKPGKVARLHVGYSGEIRTFPSGNCSN